MTTRAMTVALILVVAASSLTMAQSAASSAAPTLGQALGAGTFDLKLKLFSMDRVFEKVGPLYPEVTQRATALGGWVTYQSQPWHGLSLGLGGATSQRISGSLRTDGTRALAPGQHGYSVLHVGFLQVDAGRTLVRAGRQTLSTPLLTSLDLRMTPLTFEALTVESRPVAGLSVIASHVTGYKDFNATRWPSPGEAGGFGVSEAVSLLGATWKPTGTVTLQAWDFYAHEAMNVPYVQLDLVLPLGRGWDLAPSLQAMWQRSTGDAIAGDFSTGTGAVQIALTRKALQLHVAASVVSRSRSMLYPWRQNPSFTATVEEDQDLAGERAFAWGLLWDLGAIGLEGVTLMADSTKSYVPHPALGMSRKDQRESQVILDILFRGSLKGLKLRLFGAFIESSLSMGTIFGQDYHDVRVIASYSLSETVNELLRARRAASR